MNHTQTSAGSTQTQRDVNILHGGCHGSKHPTLPTDIHSALSKSEYIEMVKARTTT